jgi:hypothetical protein
MQQQPAAWYVIRILPPRGTESRPREEAACLRPFLCQGSAQAQRERLAALDPQAQLLVTSQWPR